LFAGIGGLDLAVEAAFGAEMTWAVEQNPHCVKVLARHWPGATIINEDVQLVDPSTLDAPDVLAMGFPCTDLSVSGKRAGLDGEKSGLYRECLRFAEVLRPQWLVFENVPGVLKYQARIESDLGALGYGAAFVGLAASDVGAPHWRRRVFIIAKRGDVHRGIVHRWGSIPEGFWPTAVADGDRVAMFKQGGEPLGRALRWPTPLARDVKDGPAPVYRDGVLQTDTLPRSVRWPTPTAGDAKSSGSRNTASSKANAGVRLTDATRGDGGTGRDRKAHPGVMNPDFVEALQGFPQGWTQPEGQCQEYHAHKLIDWPRWPMGRGEEQHWWEPPRLLQEKRIKGRPARLRALGNAVCPAQGYVAVSLGMRAFMDDAVGQIPLPLEAR
jgi:site-specific DNA-cytosine methylase